jgi:hypothetical protein
MGSHFLKRRRLSSILRQTPKCHHTPIYLIRKERCRIFILQNRKVKKNNIRFNMINCSFEQRTFCFCSSLHSFSIVFSHTRLTQKSNKRWKKRYIISAHFRSSNDICVDDAFPWMYLIYHSNHLYEQAVWSFVILFFLFICYNVVNPLKRSDYTW